MKKVLPVVFTMLLLVTIYFTQIGHVNDVFAQNFETIPITLSPETIVVSNKAAGHCTIHAGISYWTVDTSTLRLRSNADTIFGEKEIDIDVAKPDSYGNLIVMVSLKKVKTLALETPKTTLMLKGEKNIGEEDERYFLGTDIIRVKD